MYLTSTPFRTISQDEKRRHIQKGKKFSYLWSYRSNRPLDGLAPHKLSDQTLRYIHFFFFWRSSIDYKKQLTPTPVSNGCLSRLLYICIEYNVPIRPPVSTLHYWSIPWLLMNLSYHDTDKIPDYSLLFPLKTVRNTRKYWHNVAENSDKNQTKWKTDISVLYKLFFHDQYGVFGLGACDVTK